MKKIICVMICLLLLGGCKGEDSMDAAVSLRNKIIGGNACSFSCGITADYTDRVYSFRMECSFDKTGTMTFTVVEPETISDISGIIDGKGGKLTFDHKALFFQQLADGYISPVSAPWVFIMTLRSGYLSSCSKYEDGFYITIDDSYKESPMVTEIWTDWACVPVRAEILWNGRKILSLDVANFSCL